MYKFLWLTELKLSYFYHIRSATSQKNLFTWVTDHHISIPTKTQFERCVCLSEQLLGSTISDDEYIFEIDRDIFDQIGMSYIWLIRLEFFTSLHLYGEHEHCKKQMYLRKRNELLPLVFLFVYLIFQWV